MRKGIPCGVVVDKLKCDIVLIEFKIQFCYYVDFWINSLLEKYKSPYRLAMG